MLKILLLTSFFTYSLFGECQSLYILGEKEHSPQTTLESVNSLIWRLDKGMWSVSPLQSKVNVKSLECKERAYVLVNNNEISYTTPVYKNATYSLKRGWNYLYSQKDGVDIEKTFKNARGVEFVYVYEGGTEAWAGYSPLEKNMKSIINTRILQLKKIEPRKGFYVYSNNSITVKIVSPLVKGMCKTLMNNSLYGHITSSGENQKMLHNDEKNIGFSSRYRTHYRRGVYDESRETLIYPLLKTKEEVAFKYGPAVPKSMIEYAKEYEDKFFYIFDYKDEKCYRGTFPSIKTPPFASLKELK